MRSWDESVGIAVRGGEAGKQYVFVSTHLDGHLRPALAVAAALQRQLRAARAGGGVRFAALRSERCKVEAAGLPFVDLGDLPPGQRARVDCLMAEAVTSALAPRARRAGPRLPILPPILGAVRSGARMAEAFSLLEAAMLPRLLDSLLEGEAAGCDVLVADFVALAAHEAAEKLRLPLALLWQAPLGMCLMNAGQNRYNLRPGVPVEVAPGVLLQPASLGPLRRLVNEAAQLLLRVCMDDYAGDREALRAAHGLPRGVGAGLFGVPARVGRLVNVISCVRELEVPRPLPPEWHLVGPQGVSFPAGGEWPPRVGDPAISAFLDVAEADGAAVVYVCAGTVVDPSAEQLRELFGGMALLPGARFIWSLKQSCHALLPPCIEAAQKQGKLLLTPWAPQLAVLCHPAVRLFVSHGGLNSMHEGLAAGKPLLVTPFFADQPVNAQHVVNGGVGAQLDPARTTAPELAAAIARLLSDAPTAARAAALGAALRARSGPDEAADLIRRFAKDDVTCRRWDPCGAARRCPRRAWLPFRPPPLCCERHALAHAAGNFATKVALVLAADALLCALLGAPAAAFWGLFAALVAACVFVAAAS
ncbi:hypothetical protein Rsub_08740 [Raphidocelis subcapitata]|uniref:Glycosyltransferase n=1 Tax=Raphidocelis subcapitata TaxID=307507 RepID=A0A2V0PGK4_9CHLO|nr:hypothetical protein Rsub_08740 [Raphidocelis subcapitata]|eukprot:GBF96195.1 hypothetical protein Rsub_08740 [Raphidocelis subcapitata]